MRSIPLIASMLIAPGLLPLGVDALASAGVFYVPAFANPHIYRLLAGVVYVAALPAFIYLASARASRWLYPLTASLASVALFGLLCSAQPIPTEEDVEFAGQIFRHFSWHVLASGLLAGVIVAIFAPKQEEKHVAP